MADFPIVLAQANVDDAWLWVVSAYLIVIGGIIAYVASIHLRFRRTGRQLDKLT